MSDARRGLETEIQALAVRAERAREKLARNSRNIARRLGWQDSYRRLFCDDAGNLKADAVNVLRDLAREANFGVFDPRASEADLRMNEGSRRIMLHIFTRLDLGEQGLIHLAERMKEERNET